MTWWIWTRLARIGSNFLDRDRSHRFQRAVRIARSRLRSARGIALAGGQIRVPLVTSERCPRSSASRIVAQICLQRLPCSSKKGQSHPAVSLRFDHFSETLYSSDPCTSAPTSVGEPMRIFTRFPMKYLSPRSLEEALKPLRQDRRELSLASHCLDDSLLHSSKPLAGSREGI